MESVLTIGGYAFLFFWTKKNRRENGIENKTFFASSIRMIKTDGNGKKTSISARPFPGKLSIK